MDDEEMEELDKNLAAALRTFTAHGKKQQLENVRAFRSKCIELLSAYFALANQETVEVSFLMFWEPKKCLQNYRDLLISC